MSKRKTRSSQNESEAQSTNKRPKQTKLNSTGSLATETNQPTATPDVQHFKVPSKGKDIVCERRSTSGIKPSLIFTHGAGGGLSNGATKDFADGFAKVAGVVSFEGNMNLQGRVRGFEAVLEHEGAKCALGGRSMGARAAVLTAQQSGGAIQSLILVSYPMVGAAKGDSREQILLDLPEGINVLFISGTNDSMCSIANLRRIAEIMKAKTWIIEVQGADHGMNLKPKSGTQPMVQHTGVLAAQWLHDRDETRTHCSLEWSTSERKVTTKGWQASPTKQK